MDIRFHVECPFCHSSIKSDYTEFYQHLPLKCDDCTSEFPIHDVFDMYYSHEPLVQSAIDILTKYSGRLTLDPHNKYVNNIKNFLQSIDFEKIKTEAIRQMILYGDSYLLIKKNKSDKITGLELLDPRKTSIKFGARVKHGDITFRERKVSGYVVKNGKSKEHTAEDVIHFKFSRIMSYEDSYGDSLLRIILPSLYNYRLTKLLKSIMMIKD